ncbi:MAG: hypothetical protein M3527_01270 [Actinomycetota bacterium]|nr:hypothetical protein [Acidimicrobiia bacterium]MDQ3293071.1 hypothetical protein [Actinomycetota bacterium]
MRRAGAATGRIRTDMSVVKHQASGSTSSVMPATASTRNEKTLARTMPW